MVLKEILQGQDYIRLLEKILDFSNLRENLICFAFITVSIVRVKFCLDPKS
jgi:hypothetical protein